MFEEKTAGGAEIEAVHFLNVPVPVLGANVVPARLFQGDAERASVSDVYHLRSVEQICAPFARGVMAHAHAVDRLGAGVNHLQRSEHGVSGRGENSQAQNGSY